MKNSSKTIPQAEKRKNHELRLEQEKIEREQENKARAEAARKQYEGFTVQAPQQTPERPLSNKERRLLAKQQQSEAQLSTSQEDQSRIDLGSTSSGISEIQGNKAPITGSIEKQKVSKASTDDSIELAGIDSIRTVTIDQTHIHGLLPVITRLEKELTGCKIILGLSEIFPDKVETFELNVQKTKDKDNKYKCIAREGTSSKEIFIVDSIGYLTEESLQDKINMVLEDKFKKLTVCDKPNDSSPSMYNRSLHFQLSTSWKEQHRTETERIKDQEKQAEIEKRISERGKKLKSKVGRDSVQDYAKRDDSIVTGKTRTKNSMK
jgi:hypothetical protein